MVRVGASTLVLTGIATHLVVSGSQILFHYSLGHHRLGWTFFRTHFRIHHTYRARGHLVSSAYRGDEGNNTPYFLIPTILVAAMMFYSLPLDLFLIMAAARIYSTSALISRTAPTHVRRRAVALLVPRCMMSDPAHTRT
jgi:hypothetical protein